MKKNMVAVGRLMPIFFFIISNAMAAPTMDQHRPTNIDRYNGYRMVRVYPFSPSALRYLQKLADETLDLDFWQRPSLLFSPVEIMVSSKKYNQLIADLRSQGLVPITAISDVGRAFDDMVEPSVSFWLSRNARRHQRAFTYDNFYDSTEIHAKLASLQGAYPTITSVNTIGTTVGGRNIQMMTVQFDGLNANSAKPAIFIEAGIHAREWISPAGVLYALEEILKTKGTPFTRFDWYFVVLANPDGYDYTFSTDRLWRKNRNVAGSNCIGIDLNRNFGYEWGGAGASTNPCADTYGGPSAFSERETQAIRDAVSPISSRLKLYAAFHSYAQYVLLPWAYSKKFPSDFSSMKKVGKAWANGAKTVQNRYYKTGHTSWILYSAAGSSHDWAKSLGASTAFTVELPPNSASGSSGSGFIVPASEIPITGKEIFEGLKAAANSIK